MTKNHSFIDAFAGCGGLSLGLMQAGLQGRFAIEHNVDAFATLKANLLRNNACFRYRWPRWLPKQPIAIEDLIDHHQAHLRDLRGEIDVLAGGPPCQGFSTAGRRQHDDPRNHLFASYVRLVELIRPKIVLIENVRGFTMDFRKPSKVENYAETLRAMLASRYDIYEELLDVSIFGVPQSRTRYFLIAILKGVSADDPFERLDENLPAFLKKIAIRTPVSSFAAISDLSVVRCGTRNSDECPGFSEIVHKSPLTSYQKLMNKGVVGVSDLRLARHKPEIASRFATIISTMRAEGRLNMSMSEEMRFGLGLKKQALRVLDPDQPAPTITSMPDDLLHYLEPRTLTVRENARLQSFPDWFSFHGKYTTGGARRRTEVPRFTQVANAVPPLAARAIGETIIEILASEGKHGIKSRTRHQNRVKGAKFGSQ